jgi:diaminopimelate decarboxylase
MNIAGKEIKELAEKYGTPLYVYDFSRIRDKIRQLKSAFRADDITVALYYSMKANCHPAILSIFAEEGFGIDCVSPGELQLALRAGIPPDRIMYSGNYESPQDLKAALEAGVKINLDDISSLPRLLKISKPDVITFRINPGKGNGMFEQITTGGEKSKFGIPFEKAVIAYQNALAAGFNRFGAHMMAGSGILNGDHFPTMLDLFLNILGNIHSTLGIQFEFIDMGGGFGIPYYGDNSELNIADLGEKILQVFREKVKKFNLGNPALILEPGRILVGDSGYLIAQVTGIKDSYRNFVGLDAGFNSLIRPALYGAKHQIIIDGKEQAPATMKADVCGPICENTDIFARDRELPETKEGDLAIFTQVGAYGYVMSMSYNLRFRPAEVAIINGDDFLITRRETIDDYYSRIQSL